MHKQHVRSRALHLAAFTVLSGGQAVGLPSTAAQAAETEAGGYGDGEIVVTARRREESAQDVPIALTVLGGTRLEATSVSTLDQVKQQVPSLQIFAINPRNTNINLRNLGSNASVSSDGLDSGVGVYIDDVYYARPGQSVFDLVDIDRIEILKGPQGTLFGRNTTAGAISITTRAPSFTPEGTAEITYGSRDYVQARAAVSVPLVGDKIAARLTASTTVRDGTVRNVRTGRDLNNLNSQSLRGQILITPSESFSVRVIGDYSIRKEDCCVTLPAGVTTSLPSGSPIANNFYDRAGRLGYSLPTLNAFDRITDINAPSRYNVRQSGVSAKANWSTGGATLTSVTAYRTWNWEPLNDSDATGLDILSRSQTSTRQNQFSQELRVASTGERQIDYVAGLYYFRQTLNTRQLTEYGRDAPDFVIAPAVPAAIRQAALNGFRFEGASQGKTRSYAAFGQLDWHIDPRLTLTVGLRFTHEKKRGFYAQTQTGGVDLTTVAPATATAAQALRNAFGPARSLIAADTSNKVSGQINLAWRPIDGVLAYATYARGTKSGGLNLTGLAPGAPPVVNPEKVDHFELGVKTSPLAGLTLNGAAFWTEIADFQATFSDGARSLIYLTNAAKVRSRGAEVDLQATPAKGVSLYASGTYADTIYVSYPAAPCPFGTSGPNGGTICDLSGATLPNAPRWAIAAGGEAALPISAASEVYAGADWSWRSRYITASDNSSFGKIPGYAIVNGRLGVRDPNGRWDIFGWVRNLLNKDYYTRRGLAPFNTGYLGAAVGDPRTGGITGRFRF